MADHRVEDEEAEEHDESAGEEGLQTNDDAQDEYSRGAPRLPWGITKKVLWEAPVAIWEEGRPKAGDQVTIHFVARLQDGPEVQNSRDKDQPFSFMIDQSPREVIVGMDLAAMTMRRTEIAEFKIAPRFAYDDMGSAPLVPPGATMIFEIELLSWETQEDLFGDGLAIKTVVKAGDGETKPMRGQEVILNLKCTDRKGQVLEEHEHLTHKVGDPLFGPLSRAVVTSLLAMYEGERATVAFGRYFAPTSTDRRYAKATLELELEQVFESRDVSATQDKSLIKKVLRKGKGKQFPRDTSKVKLHIEAASDGNAALYGFSGPKTLEFALGNGDVCDALEFAAIQMKAGERAILTCMPPLPQCLELDLGLVNIQAPQAQLTVELLSFESIADPAGLDSKAFLSHVRARKDVAGDLYKRHRHALAAEVYRRIVELSAGRSDLQGEASTEVEKLRPVCQLNQAACMLKLNQFSRTRELCSEVLRVDEGNVKALYRRASASFGLDDYTAALRDLAKVLEQGASNAHARRLVSQVKEAQRQYTKDARKTAARMIGEEVADEDDVSPGQDDADVDLVERPETFRVRVLAKLAALSACLPVEPCARLIGLRARRSNQS